MGYLLNLVNLIYIIAFGQIAVLFWLSWPRTFQPFQQVPEEHPKAIMSKK